jgi:hypothetical protein
MTDQETTTAGRRSSSGSVTEPDLAMAVRDARLGSQGGFGCCTGRCSRDCCAICACWWVPRPRTSPPRRGCRSLGTWRLSVVMRTAFVAGPPRSRGLEPWIRSASGAGVPSPWTLRWSIWPNCRGRPTPPGSAAEAMSTDAALALIVRQPRDQAEAVLPWVVVGLDVATVARVLGRRAGAVRTAAYRGLRGLAAQFDRAGVGACMSCWSRQLGRCRRQVIRRLPAFTALVSAAGGEYKRRRVLCHSARRQVGRSRARDTTFPAHPGPIPLARRRLPSRHVRPAGGCAASHGFSDRTTAARIRELPPGSGGVTTPPPVRSFLVASAVGVEPFDAVRQENVEIASRLRKIGGPPTPSCGGPPC